MQVLCKKTGGNSETNCCVCGQGFVMFWDRQSRAERAATLREFQKVLRDHHRTSDGPGAHPNESFLFPEWNGAVAPFGKAVGSSEASIMAPT